MVDYNSLEPVKNASQVKIGDVVRLEVRGESDLPRWNNVHDCGGSGEWVEAGVDIILDEEFYVKLPSDQSWWFTFELYCDSNHQNKDGWPRLQVSGKKEVSIGTCTCSTYVVCNIGCPSNKGLECPNRQDI